METIYKETQDMGNNESLNRGIFKENDNTYLVLNYATSRRFKTLKGAERYAKKTGIIK